MTVGAQLTEARRARRLTIAQVSEQTKIQPWVLDSLEADQLYQLMSRIYVKGFLRTYARFLQLDESSLVAQLPLPAPEPEEIVSAKPHSPHAPLRLQLAIPSAWQRRMGLVAVGVAVLAGLVFINPLRWLFDISLPSGPGTQAASVSLVQDPMQPSKTPLSLETVGSLELLVKARRATWIRVRADGKLVAQQWLQRGAEERWSAQRQFELIVARPAQVDLTLNGQLISPFAIAHGGRLLITQQGISGLGSDEF